MKQNKLVITSSLLAFCLSAVTGPAATITSSKATGSSSGFGTINYTPGSNVNEFVIYGKSSAGASYITSTGSLHIAKAVGGDGVSAYNNAYDATKYSWTGGTPTLTGSSNIEACQPVASGNGWGLTPYSWASISVTAPADAFEFSFFVHNYYTSVDLEVWLGGSRLSSYSNVMSSSYSQGGGEARNTDYFYDFNFTGVTVGQTLEFKFTNIQNLGSSWANIGFLSSSLNYTPPASITSQLTSMPNTVPEPATALILGLGGALIALYRRFFGRM